MFTLRFTEGGTARTVRLADGEAVIGRAATCGVIVNAPGVSRQHAQVRMASAARTCWTPAAAMGRC